MDESLLDITGGESVADFQELPAKRHGSPIACASSRRLYNGKLASSSKQSDESRGELLCQHRLNCSNPVFLLRFK